MITGCVPTSMLARLVLPGRPLRLPLKSVSRLGSAYPGVLKERRRSYTTTAQDKYASGDGLFAYTWLTKTPDEIVSAVLRAWIYALSS